MTNRLAQDFQKRGGEILTSLNLTGITESDNPNYSLRLSSDQGTEVFASKVALDYNLIQLLRCLSAVQSQKFFRSGEFVYVFVKSSTSHLIH